MKPTLIIVRGIPGSGKSTFADFVADILKCQVFETDDFFMRNGVYVFEPEKLAWAHRVCHEKAFAAIERDAVSVIANCDIRWRDLKDLIEKCDHRAVRVMIYDVLGDFGSVHDIPQHRMEKIRQGFSLFPKLIPFFLRDGYDPNMITSYATVTPVPGAEPLVEYKPLDFNVAPARKQ